MTDENTRLPSDSVELKPCPFCEADAYFEGGVEERDDRRYFSMTVCCGSCEATITEAINFTEYSKLGERGAYQRLKEMCSAAWNMRPEPASLSPPRDDVRELLEEAAKALGDACLSVHDELLDRIDTALSQTDEQPRDDEDDARLMAAAPELLAALVGLLPDFTGGIDPTEPEAVIKARAAIAKAKGGEV